MKKLITGFNPDQNGFAPEKSLVTQLTAHIEQVLAAVDSGNATAGAYFDFVKTFDPVHYP